MNDIPIISASAFRHESVCCTKIIARFNDIKLGSSSGFLYRFGQELALVTNWHALSGRNPNTNLYINQNHPVPPNFIDFHITISKQSSIDSKVKNIEFREITATLYDESRCYWLRPEAYTIENGQTEIPDIGIIKINEEDYGLEKNTISSLFADVLILGEDSDLDQEIYFGTPKVGADVFMLGYPRGILSQGIFPVWKRGSIASEPLFNALANKPVILVDAATKSGMSGAPVIYFGPEITNRYGTSVNLLKPNRGWLIGVYSGREGVTTDENEMQLGRIWKREYVDSIFFNNAPGLDWPIADN